MNTAAGGKASAAGRGWLPRGVPAHLGEYRLIRPLGSGGIGMVFEGQHRLLEQRVAVKVLHPRHATDSQFAARFRREMAAFGRVPDHPNLVRAHYAGEEAGVLFLVMDFVAGADLGHVVRRHRQLPVSAACAVVCQALDGLQAIHRAGMVHRDLKPANLMLTTDGTVKILDLGMARLREPGADDLTPSNVMLGTLDYLAPEQAVNARHVDIRADVYSLGCTLYKLLSGSAPFEGRSSFAEKIRAHAAEPFPALGEVAPAGLDEVLARMTAKSPADRFATPGEAAEALAPFADGSTLTTLVGEPAAADTVDEVCGLLSNLADTPPPGPGTPTPAATTVEWEYPPRARRRRFAIAALLVGVVAAASLAGAYLATRPSGQGGAAKTNEQEPAPVAPPVPPAPGPVAPNPEPKAVDVLPPGTPTRNLSLLTRLDSHDLFDQPPVEAVWNPAAGYSLRLFDSRKRLFHVDSHREAMFHLGDLRRPSYTLQVQIRQSNWRSGMGVYFGYRSTKASEATFQYVIFVERSDKNEKQNTYLSRGRGRVYAGKDGKPLVQLSALKDEQVEKPIEVGILTLEVANRKLTKVLLDGVRELKSLVARDTDQQFPTTDYDGETGLIVKTSGCVFTEVRLKITNDW